MNAEEQRQLEIVRTKRSVIDNKLLAELEDTVNPRAAILVDETDLLLLIAALDTYDRLQANAHAKLFKSDLIELRKAAFP